MHHHPEYFGVYLLTNKNILQHYHNSAIKIRKLTLIDCHHIILRHPSNVASCTSNVLYYKKGPVEDHILHLFLMSSWSPSIWNSFLGLL